jgi:myo-inositol-1(or 4)-monophosphatase
MCYHAPMDEGRKRVLLIGASNVYFFQHLTLKCHGIRRPGSASLDLTSVACGRIDGYWEFNLNPWDTAAGVQLVRKAGGRVTRFDGSPWRLDSRETLATNGLIHDEILREFDAVLNGHGIGPRMSPTDYAKTRNAGIAQGRSRPAPFEEPS